MLHFLLLFTKLLLSLPHSRKCLASLFTLTGKSYYSASSQCAGLSWGHNECQVRPSCRSTLEGSIWGPPPPLMPTMCQPKQPQSCNSETVPSQAPARVLVPHGKCPLVTGAGEVGLW